MSSLMSARQYAVARRAASRAVARRLGARYVMMEGDIASRVAGGRALCAAGK